MKKVIIIRGLPGCGKTTMAMQYYVNQKGYKHCEADHYFHNNGVYSFNAAKLNEAHEYCINKALAEIERGGKVVISDTLARKWEIKEIMTSLPVNFNDVEILHCHGGTGSNKDVPDYYVNKVKDRWQVQPGEKHVTLDFSNAKPRVIRHELNLAKA